jgi:phosphoribosylglycinamide formyltransferase-1
MKKGKVAVFLSGRGSNFESIYRASLKKDSNYKIVIVISDKKKARGLKRAKKFKLENFYISPKLFKTKKEYNHHIIKLLKINKVDLVCLAGFMRIIDPEFIKEYKNRIINIHPALLPSFPGLNVQKQAVDHGVKVSGCTVHFVNSGIDTGPIILQKPVKVRSDDNEDTLSKRILKEEHKIYPEAIKLFFENRLKFEGRKVIILDR